MGLALSDIIKKEIKMELHIKTIFTPLGVKIVCFF
jgi:hypothetical protein